MTPFHSHSRNATTRWARATLFLLVSGALIGMIALQWRSFHKQTLAKVREFDRLAEGLPHLSRQTDYVSSKRCQACHPSQHASWHQTYHRTMTQIALPENVAGNFDGSTITSEGIEYRVHRKDNEFWAEMPDPDVMMLVVQGGRKMPVERIPRVQRRVVMTTGSHHYQTYWVESQRFDRLMQTLPLVYLIKDKRWIPREAAFMRPPRAERMITQWNHHCIRCHSTGGVPGLDKKTGMLNSSVGELGIACEACHGPGEEHIRRNQDPTYRYQWHLTGRADPTIVNPARLSHQKSSEVCGQCHGVYIMQQDYAMKYAYEGTQYRPGEDLHKVRYYIQHPRNEPSKERIEELKRNPSFFRERWWDDGTVLAGGREFTAMSVSGCYKRGNISCLSCHSMHDSEPADQLRRDLSANTSCTQCHDQPQYTTQVKRHTFHEPSSSGSDCLNCHMPHTTYALLGAIRNHQIDAPNLAGSIRYGVPNACNLCHLDKTLAWTQDHMARWYGNAKLELTLEQQTVSAALLWMLKGHAAQRVISVWHAGWQPAQEASGADWLAPFVAQLLYDPYGVVRYVAGHNLRNLPGFEDFDYDFLAPKDELKTRRIDAISVWERRTHTSESVTGTHVMIDDSGQLLRNELRVLVKNRDDRAVSIKE